MNLLLKIHGELRWLVALAASVVVVRSLVGWVRREDYRAIDRIGMAALTGLLDLNLLLGLVLLFGLGGLAPYRLEHALTMVLAVATAHLSAIWRRSEDAARKLRNNLLVAVAVLVLVAIGVIRLRGGFFF